MTTYSLSLRAHLDRPAPEPVALAVGRTWADTAGLTLSGTTYGLDEPRFGVVAAGDLDPIDAPALFAVLLRNLLAEHGLTIREWTRIEVITLEESARQLQAYTVPPMVSAVELAELAGVTTQRIYDLESKRKAAADRGERTPFPAPVVPGYWLRSAADHWASTRRRKPGPAPSR